MNEATTDSRIIITFSDVKRQREVSPNILETDTQYLYESTVAAKQASIKKSQCTECKEYTASDNRTDHFSHLLREEFKYIRPCMYTHCFVKILQFLDSAKKNHYHEIETNTEIN